MKKFLLLIPAVVFLFISLWTIRDYGINWDSPEHFLRGQAYVDVFLRRQSMNTPSSRLSPVLISKGEYVSRYLFAAIEFDEKPAVLPVRPLPQVGTFPSYYQYSMWNAASFSETFGPGHPPLPDILAALSNRVFYQTFRMFGDIESYAVPSLLIAAIGIALVGFFTLDITGSLLASLAAEFSLALFPYYITEAHINLKDPAQAVFFTGAIWAFWHWVKDRKIRWFAAYAAFVTLAAAVKWNIAFLPFILVPWLFAIRKTHYFKQWFVPKRVFGLALVAALACVVFLVATWPDLWVDPFGRLLTVMSYYWRVGTGTDLVQPPGFILPMGFNIYPMVLVITQTPIIILFLAVTGIMLSLRRQKDELYTVMLLVVWLFVPILRVSLPHTRTYGGIRQIMEIVPVMAILAGVGVNALIRKTKGMIRNGIMGIIFILFLMLIPTLIRLHPNEHVFFNGLVGGVPGAARHNLMDWTLTYGNVYKQAAQWLNAHAGSNANIAFLDGTTYALSPRWLRQDISISPYHFSGFAQKGEYLMVLPNPFDPPVFAYQYPKRFLRPVHEITADGVVLLSIYQNDPAYSALAVGPIIRMNAPVSTRTGDYWEVDLGRTVGVTEIVANGAPASCLWHQSDFLAFVKAEDRDTPIDKTRLYVLNERRDLSSGRIAFIFPREQARYIRIYPQSMLSCFARGMVAWVSYTEL